MQQHSCMVWLTGAGTNDRLDPILLTINVISASQLPKPGGVQKGEIIDPYVVVYVNGPNDSFEVKTRTINDNGFNPVWNQVMSYCYCFCAKMSMFVNIHCVFYNIDVQLRGHHS